VNSVPQAIHVFNGFGGGVRTRVTACTFEHARFLFAVPRLDIPACNKKTGNGVGEITSGSAYTVSNPCPFLVAL